MKEFLTTILLLISASSIAQTSLELSFSKEDFHISNDELIMISTNLKERRVIGDTLSPCLPYFPYRIIVPENINSVFLSIECSKNIVAENIRIAANPKPNIRDGRTSLVTGPRESTRSVETPVINAGIKLQNGVSYLLLYVTPFLYDEPSGKLYFVSYIHIDFEGLPSGQRVTISSLPEILSTCQIADTFVDNQQPRTDNDTIDYLIVTNNNLKSSFSALAQWKQRKCLRCKIVTKEEIDTLYPQYGNSCARIKAYIMDYASPTRKKWVLLGGDDSVVPSKVCSDDDFPFLSDFYYTTDSIFSEVEWGTNEDGLVADCDLASYNPYVYLSRLPVRTAQQVQDYTCKLIDYEMGVGVNNNMLLAGFLVKFRNEVKSDSHMLNEEVYDEFVSNYWNGNLNYIYDTGTSFRVNHNDSILISGENLKNVMDDCLFNILHEISHGDSTYWKFGNFAANHYNISHAQAQTNYPGSVIVTGACLTNQFEAEPCLSESLLRNSNGGAVAYFGSSGLGVGGESYCSNGSTYIPLIYSDQYDGHFLQNLYTGIPSDKPYSLAAIATEAKSTVYNEFHATDSLNHYQYLLVSINTMGDPEMPIWTDSIKSFTSGSGPSTGPYIIHSMVGGRLDVISPVGGCTIVVLDEHGNRQEANNTSYASFSGLSGQTYVAIMKHNYIPYLRTTNVSSGGILPNLLSLQAFTSAGQMLTIRLEDQNNSYLGTEYVTDEWQLMIADVARGDTKLVQVVEGDNCQINTSGWPSGIYAIHAYKNGNTASTKIFIQ